MPWNKNVVRVWVRPIFLQWSDDYGHARVRGYEADPASTIYSGGRGTENDPEMQGRSKGGEYAAAICLGGDAEKLVNRNANSGPDKGHDFVIGHIRPDVKTTEHFKKFVLWSVSINGKFDSKDFTHIISVTVVIDNTGGWESWWIEGYMTKEEFKRRKRIADGVEPKGLEKGTWYVLKSEMNDIRELKLQAQRGFVGYDNEGRFRTPLLVRALGIVRRRGLLAPGQAREVVLRGTP